MNHRLAEQEHASLTDQLKELTARASRAEGAEGTLRDALADRAGRLDLATDKLRELRRPWWRRLIAAEGLTSPGSSWRSEPTKVRWRV
jgi:hypothetical protein